MKHIVHKQYLKMQEALKEHVSQQTDPYGYLFLLINGYPSNTSRPRELPVKLLRTKKIQEYWNNPKLSQYLIRLAIFKKYDGHIVDTGEISSIKITRDFIEKYARNITTQSHK